MKQTNTRKQKNKGITLVALIITIIVMVILAAITLYLTIGQKGLIARGQDADQKHKQSEVNEQKSLNELYSSMMVATNDSSNITISMEDLNNLISAKVKEEVSKISNTSAPVGSIIAQMSTTTPDGYLYCDGAVYNIADYSNLAEHIKTQFGSYNYWGGDGETTFAVPNLQGEFLRGYSKGSTVSKTTGITTAKVGAHQNATEHINLYTGSDANASIYGKSNSIQNPDKFVITGTTSGGWYNRAGDTNSTSNQRYISRPTNTSVLYCIKY